MEGEIADVPISNAFIPTGDGRVYVIVGPEVRDAADVGLSDRVEMRFKVADQNAVDVPDRLAERLEQNPRIKSLWERLPPGKKRGMSHHVGTAKTDKTREKRVDDVLEAVTDYNGNMRDLMDARRGRK
ncbi:MAG: YdeI/OmpD-associated family protein [Pseudomonadota bacterium]